MTDLDTTPRRITPQDECLAVLPEALERTYDRQHALYGDLSGESARKLYALDQGVAVVSVDGPLESRAGYWWDGYAGPTGVTARVLAALADPAATAVLLMLSSPGGSAGGLFESLDTVRGALASSRKPLVAYTETAAYSAAYALATLARTIFVGRAAGVGSVGVIAVAVSQAEALAKDGIAVAVVTSGDRKADLHPALPLNPDAVARLRARVTQLAAFFAAEVARTRPLTRAAVLAQQAAVFHGAEAVAAGLADAVSTYPAALATARRLGAQEKSMSTAALALGLDDAATDAQLAARAQSLLDVEKRLLAATGETSADAALGAVEAHKAASAKLAALEAEVATLRAAGDAQERAALIVQGVKDKVLTPALVQAWVPTQSTASLRGYLAHASKITPPDPPAEPSPSAGLAGKTWEQLAPMEQYHLRDTNRAQYDALLADYQRRTHARSA
jgi:ClpP class serine protease